MIAKKPYQVDQRDQVTPIVYGNPNSGFHLVPRDSNTETLCGQTVPLDQTTMVMPRQPTCACCLKLLEEGNR